MSRRPYSFTVRLTILLAVGLLLLQTGVFAWTLHARSLEQFRLMASDRARMAITMHQVVSSIPPADRGELIKRLVFHRSCTLSLLGLTLRPCPSFP